MGLLAFALQQRQPATLEPAPSPITISLLAPERAIEPTVVKMSPRLETPSQVLLLPSELVWETSDSPPVRAPTAAVEPVSAQSMPQVAEPRASAPLEISRAEYLRAPTPHYPPMALASRREGSVGLRVLVAEDGRVIDVEVERPSGFPPFDEAACSAVRAAVFKPYTVNGEPRTVLIRIPIDFTLKRRGA